MKGLIYNVDGRKVLYIGNLLPDEKCFVFENAELLQEIEYDDIKMIYIDDISISPADKGMPGESIQGTYKGLKS